MTSPGAKPHRDRQRHMNPNRICALLALICLLSICTAGASSGSGHVTRGDEWRRAAYAQGGTRPFVARPSHLSKPNSSPGHDAKRTLDPKTGHTHYNHEEFRTNKRGHRTHLQFTAVQVADLVSLDEEENVLAVHCAHSPASLSVVLRAHDVHHGHGNVGAETRAHHSGTHKFKPGSVVVGGEHWDCSTVPAFGDSDRDDFDDNIKADKNVQVGLMARILEVHEHECSVAAKGEAAPGAGAEFEEAGVGSVRGTCVDMRTEQVALSEIFRDLDLTFNQEDLGALHKDSWRIDERTYKSRGHVRGHDFDPKDWRPRSPVHGLHSGSSARTRLKEHIANATSTADSTKSLRPLLGSRPYHHAGADHAHEHQRKLHFLHKKIASAFKAVVAPIVQVAKAVVNVAKQAVSTVASIAKSVVKTVVQFPITLMNKVNDAVGGKLDFLVKPATQALRNFESKVIAKIEKVEEDVNRMLDFVSLAIEAASCLAGDCDITFRLPGKIGANFNFDEYFHRQLHKFPKFSLDFAVNAGKDIPKKPGASVQGNAYGSVTIDPTELYFWAGTGMKFQMKVTNYNLDLVRLTQYAGVKAKIAVFVSVSITFDVGVYKELFKKEWDVSFSIGPVKITVIPQIIVGTGLLGDISLTWENNLEGGLTAGVEFGLQLKSGKLEPVAGWMDGQPPSFTVPELVPPTSVYLDVIFQLVPEVAVDLGIYGIRFLNFQVQIYFKLGVTWSPIGTGAGCDGGLQLWIGFVPYIAANLKLDSVIKLPSSLTFRLAGHYFDSTSNIWKNTWDKYVLVQKTCPEPAPDGPKPAFDIKMTRRAATSLEFGWFYPRSDLQRSSVVAFRIAVREGGSDSSNRIAGEEYVTVMVPELTGDEYTAAQKWPLSVTTVDNEKVDPAACGPSGMVMTYDPVVRRCACRKYSGFTVNKLNVPQASVDPSLYRITFASVFKNLKPNTIYGVEIEAKIVDNKKILGQIEGSNGVSVVKTLPSPPAAPGTISLVSIESDKENPGKFVATIKWPAPATRPEYFQALVTPARNPTSVPSPCKAGTQRIATLHPTVPCIAQQGVPDQSPDPALVAKPPAQSAALYDYVPTTDGSATTLRIPGLLSGIVYNFDVQQWVKEPLPDPSLTCTNVPSTAKDAILCSFYGGYASSLKLQMPGLPNRAFVGGNTSLPFVLSVARLDCGVFNVSWVPQTEGYGAAVAALTKKVILKMTSDLAGSVPRYLTIDVNPNQDYYSVLVNISSATQRVVIRNFVIGAVTSAGYSASADGSNVVRVVDRPCSSTCPLSLLDDVLLGCPDTSRYLTMSFGGDIATQCPQTPNATSSTLYPCAAALAPPSGRRRRALSAVLEASIASHVRTGRMILADPSSFSSDPPPDEPADTSFVITKPLPLDPTLAAAADAAPAPEDFTAVAKPDAEAYRSMDRYAPVPDEPGSIQARMRAERNQASTEFANKPYTPEPFRAPDAELSKSKCPPDHKVTVSSAARRTTLPSLCAYQVTGSVKVCGQASTHAVQFLYNATETAVYRFDVTASGFPAVVDVRSYDACDPKACSAPLVGGEEDGQSRVSVFLIAGSPVAITVAAAGGANCGQQAPAQPVVLDISRDTVYDFNIIVDGNSANDTAAAGANAAVVTLFATAQNLSVQQVSTAGRPITVGIFLTAGVYVRSTATSWSVPAIPAADGSTIWIRSLSGLGSGPNSAGDTMLSCNGFGPAFTVSHKSPLVLPMGVGIASCGLNATAPEGQEQSGSAVTIRKLKGILLKAVSFMSNVNTLGTGGAVSVLDGASVAISYCSFGKNKAAAGGGAVAVFGGSSVVVGNTTFFMNEALAGGGGAVLVGSASDPAGEVSFSGCSLRENAAGLAMVDPLQYTSQAPSLNRPALAETVVDEANYDPVKRIGGALALVRSTATITVVGTSFSRNLADAGGAIWAGTPLDLIRSNIFNSFGDGLAVSNTEATLSIAVFRDNGNIFEVAGRAGGALTCLGAAAKVTVSLSMFEENSAASFGGAALIAAGCTAAFSESSFTSNAAVFGGAVAVGILGAAEDNAGGARFTLCTFKLNGAGDIDMRKIEPDIPSGIGQGGAIAVLGTATPVVVEDCVISDNIAFSGGGIYAVDSISLLGAKNVLFNNTAGFDWYVGDEAESGQIGGGILIAPFGKPQAMFEIQSAIFTSNMARGSFGGGVAILSGLAKLNGTTLIQNTAVLDDGQGGGLFLGIDARLTNGSKYFATANEALGAFKNVFFAAQAKAVADAAGGSADASAKSCYQCTPCQVCGVESGRCQFPDDLEQWCQYTGSCNKDSCDFVTIGAAKFDEKTFKTLYLELDISYAVPAGSKEIPCTTFFTAETIKSLGSEPKCSIKTTPSAGRRGLLQGGTAQSIVVDLGNAFSLQPGASLSLNMGGLPTKYSSLSNNAIVEISQASKPVSAVASSILAANGTLVGGSSSSGSSSGAIPGDAPIKLSTPASAAARAAPGGAGALGWSLALLATLLSSLLVLFV